MATTPEIPPSEVTFLGFLRLSRSENLGLTCWVYLSGIKALKEDR